MFDIYGCHFIYGDFDSSQYDLIFANLTTDRNVALNATQSLVTMRSKRNNMFYVSNKKYDDEPLTFEAEILQKDGKPIGMSFLRKIEQSLFCKQNFTKLRPLISYDEEFHPTYINCIFINPTRIEVENGIIGYKFNVILDSPMAWAEETIITPTVTNNSFEVNVDSDAPDYIYPTVTIDMTSGGGNLTICNTTDDIYRNTIFTGLPASSHIVMSSSLNHITGVSFTYFTGRNFIRLLPGLNTFTVSGNLSAIEFKFNNRKFL